MLRESLSWAFFFLHLEFNSLFVSQDIEFAFQCQKALFLLKITRYNCVDAKKKRRNGEKDHGRISTRQLNSLWHNNNVVTDWIISWFELQRRKNWRRWSSDRSFYVLSGLMRQILKVNSWVEWDGWLVWKEIMKINDWIDDWSFWYEKKWNFLNFKVRKTLICCWTKTLEVLKESTALKLQNCSRKTS